MAQQLSQSSHLYPFSAYTKLVLENRTAGHRKFYEMTNGGTNTNTWTARWGAIGTTGQTMDYSRSKWTDKLVEKMKKGYVLIEAQTLPGKPVGIEPPVVKPRKPDPAILIDPEVMAKLDRIEVFLDEKGNVGGASTVSDIKIEYVRTGVLTRDDMETLNNLWIRNGGGKW